MKWLKRIFYLVIIISLSFYLLVVILSDDLPEGKLNSKATVILNQMRKASGYDKWQKETSAIEFTFAEKNKHFYDKKRGYIEVIWDNYQVQIDKKTMKGIVFENNEPVTDTSKTKNIIDKAWAKFINDMFWFNPLFQVFGPGAKHYYIDENNIKVTFLSGGVTPGDSYVFEKDERGLLKNMRMWVSIIPVKGAVASYDNYVTTDNGIKVATEHQIFFFNIRLTEIKSYREYPVAEDRFKNLIKFLSKSK